MSEPLMKSNSIVELLNPESRKQINIRLPLNANRKPASHADCKFGAGTVIITNNEPELIVDRIYAPCLGNVEGMIEVTGDSMAPTYINGCRIAITRLNDYRILNWGQCYYILDKNWQGFVRRVYKSEKQSTIKLVSDYTDQTMFPPFYRSWEEIAAIFQIIACIVKQ